MAGSEEGLAESAHGHEFAFIGGATCLDFVNTLAWATGDNPVDHLRSYRDLVDWACQAGLLAADARPRLAERASAMPDLADDMLARAITLREAIRHITTAVIAHEAASESSLTVLNGELSAALSRSVLDQASPGVFGWSGNWCHDGGEIDLGYPLWPVARSAAEVLTSSRLDRVKICQGPRCGWMFVDESRNGSRRWCDSRDCGNRERVRRHYARRRTSRA